MLTRFKQFDTDRMDLDELVELVAFGTILRAQYAQLNLEEPEFVDIQLKTLKREIRAKNADRNAARVKELKLQLEGLKTPTERKTALQKELRQREAQLQEV